MPDRVVVTDRGIWRTPTDGGTDALGVRVMNALMDDVQVRYLTPPAADARPRDDEVGGQPAPAVAVEGEGTEVTLLSASVPSR